MCCWRGSGGAVGVNAGVRAGFDNTTGSAVYYVLYVLLLYYVLIQIIHACWQPGTRRASPAPTARTGRLQQYAPILPFCILESRHHGILSVPILPFWGQDIMAYFNVPILPSWGQDITAYLSVPIPPLKRLCNYMCRVVLLYYFSASRVLCIIRIIIY